MKWLSLRIGGQRWGVYVVASGNPNLRHAGKRCMGVCDPVKCRIYISRDQSQASLEDTLLHELLHATLKVTGADEAYARAEQVEEDIVKPVTPVLHGLLLDLGFVFPKGPIS